MLVHGSKNLNIVKKSILPKLIYRVKKNSIKILTSFFEEIEKLIIKFIWKYKKPRINKTTSKKNKAGEITLPDFEIYYSLQ